jgi:hypothetical protein
MIRPTTKRRSILGYLSALMLAQVGLVSPLARGNEKDKFQKAVSAQINDLVTRDVETFFRQLHLEEPVKVEATTDADVDTSDAVPRVTKITLNVNVVTDQPSQVVRQARHRLVRLLREQGYRFDSAEGISGDSRPLAVLNIQTTPPPSSKTPEEKTWVYAGFAGLILALFTSVLTLMYILFLPWIRWYRAKKALSKKSPRNDLQEPSVRDLPPFPSPPVDFAPYEEQPKPKGSVDLPPLPPVLDLTESSAPKPANRTSSIEVGGWSTLSQPD